MLLNVDDKFLPNYTYKVAQLLSEYSSYYDLCKKSIKRSKNWTKISDRNGHETSNICLVNISYSDQSLREKCPNTEFFLVRIFLYSHWIQKNTPYLDPFHAVNRTSILTSILTSSVDLSMKHKQDLALNLMSRGYSYQKLWFIFYPSISPLMFHINHTDFFLSSRQCMCPKIFKTHRLSFWPSYATIIIVSLQSLQQPCCK